MQYLVSNQTYHNNIQHDTTTQLLQRHTFLPIQINYTIQYNQALIDINVDETIKSQSNLDDRVIDNKVVSLLDMIMLTLSHFDLDFFISMFIWIIWQCLQNST
jgi:hypothetical protein